MALKPKLYTRLPPRYQRFADRVSRNYNVSLDRLFANKRGTPREADARHILMYMICTQCDNFSEVGRLLGRDRTTIRNGYLKIRSHTETDVSLINFISRNV